MPLTALVTGGNRGLGLEICRIILLEEPSSHVFLGCRDLEVGRRAVATLDANGGHIEALCIDVSSKARTPTLD